MAVWKKSEFDSNKIDCHAVEDMLSDLLDSFDAPEVDFTRPVKLGFSVTLDHDGLPRVHEFEISNEEAIHLFGSEPLIDMVDSGKEITVVIEMNNMNANDIGVQAVENAILISNRKLKKLIKRIEFPCKVKPSAVRTRYNNNLLEIRLPKAGREELEKLRPRAEIEKAK